MLAATLIFVMALTFLVTFLVVRRFDRAHQTTSVHCAQKNADFDVDVLVRPRSWAFGDRYKVAKCSAFEPQDHVHCDQACLKPIVGAIKRT